MTIKRVVIVDDEPAARHNLREVIDTFEQLQVIAEFSDGQSAINAITALQPDIVFLDVEMPEINGFEVAKATQHQNYQLVFVTAYEQYALDAFTTKAIDYLLKPVRPSLIEKCINKILHQEEIALEKQVTDTAASEAITTITLSDGAASRVINLKHINCIEGLGRYRRIHLTAEGKTVQQTETILCEITLNDFSQLLPSHHFMRVHRSYIINIAQVLKVQTKIRRHSVFLQEMAAAIPVARSQFPALKSALKTV